MTRTLSSLGNTGLALVSALSLALVATPALARDMGGYIGGSVGTSSIEVCDDLNALGFSNCDDEDTGFKIYGGYKFNRNFALEGGYVDFGEITVSGPTVTVETDALFGAAVGILPIGNQFALFGKVGLFFWDISASGPGGSISDDGTDALFGLGASFDITPNIAVRAEWESYDSGSDEATLISAGIQYNF